MRASESRVKHRRLLLPVASHRHLPRANLRMERAARGVRASLLCTRGRQADGRQHLASKLVNECKCASVCVCASRRKFASESERRALPSFCCVSANRASARVQEHKSTSAGRTQDARQTDPVHAVASTAIKHVARLRPRNRARQQPPLLCQRLYAPSRALAPPCVVVWCMSCV